MLKKSLFVVAALALLAGAAQAGEYKTHGWEITKQWVKQELCTIDVTMDIGYWVHCKDQDKLKIKLAQESIHSYYGCKTVTFENNFDLIASATVASTGKVPGKLEVYVNAVKDGSVQINRPGGSFDVCVRLKDADLGAQAGGTKNVHVATVTLWVMPAASP